MKLIKVLLILLTCMNSIYSQENDVKYLSINEDSVVIEEFTYLIESNALRKIKTNSFSFNNVSKTFSYNDKLVYLQPDINPKFDGGETALYDFLNSFFINFSQSNTIINVAFIVNRDGIVEDVFVKRGYKDGNDLFAINIVHKMPKWIPAQQKGCCVNSLVSLKIDFVYKPLK
jgi:periplasmic protein TonB